MKVDLRTGIMLLLLACLAPSVSNAQTADVWPGDMDNNGIVNNIDVLYLGKAFGTQGPARNDTSLVWAANTATVWQDSIPDSVRTSIVFSDANGDGVVNDYDTNAIVLNYGLTHGNYTGNVLGYSTGTDTDPPLFLANVSDTVEYGQALDLYCTLGSPSYPVDSFFGLAFSMYYDTNIVKRNSITAQLDTRWVDGAGGVLMLQRDVPDSGRYDVAISLKNVASGVQNFAATGYGNIVKFSMVIEDNVIGVVVHAPFALRSAILVDHQFKTLALNIMDDTITVQGKTTGINDPLPIGKVDIYPNPTTGQLTIDMGTLQANTIQLYNIVGAQVMQTAPEKTGRVGLNVGNLPNGIYIVRIATKQGVITQKLIIEH